MGLYSFMQEESPTYGSISTSDAFKRQAAQESLEFNVKNKYEFSFCTSDLLIGPKLNVYLLVSFRIFCELFPELVEYHEECKKVLTQKTCLFRDQTAPILCNVLVGYVDKPSSFMFY
jgi:hypothetical protein